MIKYQDIYNYVLSQNEILKEVIPHYRINVYEYFKKEPNIIDTYDITIANSINAPRIETEILNQEEYDKYHNTILDYKERTEYIWYLLLKEEWSHLSEEKFEEYYKKTFDLYYKNGGFDLVAEKMEYIVKSYVDNYC